jgi:integrase
MTTTPTLRSSLADYLAVRRSLGYKLERAGLLLGQFVSFCELAGSTRVTRELALAWVCQPSEASPSWLDMRLSAVRGFATWLQASDPATEVPDRDWLPPRHRPTPFVYTDTEVEALIAVASRARWPLSAATYDTLIGLLSVTGMRIGEAIRLDRADLALDEGLLTIRNSKFGKSRQLMVHPTTVAALRTYLHRRAALSPTPGEPALFVHPAGNRINYVPVCAMFHALVRRAGVEPRAAGGKPTIHGLRHTFAVNSLIRWYRDGLDVGARLPVLSTWMGHVEPKGTYWYLSAVPELLSLAAERLEVAAETLS